METFRWEQRSEFANRRDDLAALERWWAGPSRDALAMIGRRRVGKSWLFRRFADGKPALVLVADRRLPATQMRRFAEQIEPHLGVRPDLPDLASLIAVLYRLGSDRKVLAVVDEFPYLLPDGAAREAILSEVQAAMEERGASKTKLILCGSVIGQMESLLAADGPLHGRLRELDVWPLGFGEARELSEPADSPEQRITRYAISGGMARYLAELGHGGLREQVCESVLAPKGPLFNDPRAVLEQELRSPATHFSILEELAANPALTEHLTTRLQLDASAIWPFIHLLHRMRLVESALPVGAPRRARSHKHRISDGFIRFWFRFVFPHQERLQSGLRPRDLWDSEIEPQLPDFVSATFEDLCRRYTLLRHGAQAPRVGSWWGRALDRHRRAKARFTEEVDVVGARHRQLKIVGECKWSRGAMSAGVLNDLREFKLPAIAAEGRLKVPAGGPSIMLFSRAGFSRELEAEAAENPALSLIDPEALVSGLSGSLGAGSAE